MTVERVAVTRIERDIGAALEEALRVLGGAAAFFRPGEDVVLKPNLVAPRESDTGATTDLAILGALAGAVRSAGAVPLYYETPGLEYDIAEVEEALGVDRVLTTHGIERIGHDSEMVEIQVPHGKALRTISVPKPAAEGAVVSVAKMKTHAVTGVTLGIKNLMGLLASADKRWMHVVGIDRALADLYAAVRPRLTVIDAGVAMEGDGAVYGDARSIGLLITGGDALSVDLAALEIMGLPVDDAPHLAHICARFGRPTTELVGAWGDVSRPPLAPPRTGALYRACYRLLYVGDLVFEPLFGRHLNRFIYATGLAGTRPAIVRASCDGCGDCVRACPVDAIDLEAKAISSRDCLRCLRCYEACTRGAIRIRGISRPSGDETPTGQLGTHGDPSAYEDRTGPKT